MFEITDIAAEQFIAAAESIGDGNLSLRISARKSPQQGILYNMGFDNPKDNDIVCSVNGVEIIVDNESVENVRAMIIDFREFEGQQQFVFINPNDIKENCETSPSGCDPVGNASCKACKEE